MGSNGITPSPTHNEKTDLLIVGAGPAGASLACFLSEFNLKGILISSASAPSTTPRAHITNPAALECLRDIGLEEKVLQQATFSKYMQHCTWSYTMTGPEYARIHSWGNDPHRQGEHYDVSPCRHVDLPQTLSEPLLLERAKEKGWDIRRSQTQTSFVDHGSEGSVTSTILDIKTNTSYTIESRYMFGADGGRSSVVRALDIPLNTAPGSSTQTAVNVLARADLSASLKHRVGNLHWIIQPDREHPPWGVMSVTRMVKPWTEWVWGILPAPNYDPEAHSPPTNEQYIKKIRNDIGDDSIGIEILDVSKWTINEVVASHYSSESLNIHCLGDAVHRHPPFNGLGSNTCIQDAYNLAWKVAYVLAGHAGKSLLKSYNLERQPVGAQVVRRANQGFRDHLPILETLGMTLPTVEERTTVFKELDQGTPAGVQRRERLRQAVKITEHEFSAIGVEMNQFYDVEGNSAVFFDRKEEEKDRPALPQDAVLHHLVSTYPGSRLPHAWLNTRVPAGMISTHDLTGAGSFTLLTGTLDPDKKWAATAKEVGSRLQVPVRHFSIGWKCDYEDVYGRWAEVKGVEEDGCVLVRPDRFVAWRSRRMQEKPGEVLESVMRQILCLKRMTL